jgi:zinc protease
VEEAILQHVERMAAELPDPVELERARNRALIDYYSALQKLETRADLLSQFTTYFDNPAGVEEEADRYREITGQDLQDYAAQWLQPVERVVLTFVPRRAAA